MTGFGDGREERLAAFDLERRLARDPGVKARREAYEARVAAARAAAREMGKAEIIDALIEQTPTYIRELLETEDERFGSGALVERYARTFA